MRDFCVMVFFFFGLIFRKELSRTLKKIHFIFLHRNLPLLLYHSDFCFRQLSNFPLSCPFGKHREQSVTCAPPFSVLIGIENSPCVFGQDHTLACPFRRATGGTSEEVSLCKGSSGWVSSTVFDVFQMPPTASLFMFLAFTVSTHVVIFISVFQGLWFSNLFHICHNQ